MKIKLYTLLLFISLLLTFSLSNTGIASEKLEHILIEEYKGDVTGDGLKESVYLYGDLLSSDSKYFHNIYVIIKAENNNKWKIHYKGGYEPRLSLLDFTHNGTVDILFQSKIADEDSSFQSTIHSIKQHEVKKIKLPKQILKGEFIDNFQATLVIPLYKKSITLDLHTYKSKLLKSGLYNKDGTLSKTKQLLSNKVNFYEPVLISQTKGYGLKSYQHIKDSDQTNHIITVESLWYYENNQWINLHTNWSLAE